LFSEDKINKLQGLLFSLCRDVGISERNFWININTGKETRKGLHYFMCQFFNYFLFCLLKFRLFQVYVGGNKRALLLTSSHNTCLYMN